MTSKKLVPFILSLIIIAADQITKLIIVRTIDIYTVGSSYFNGILRIIHVRNKAIAFSLGHGLPDNFRTILFSFLPLIILVFLIVYIVKSDELTKFQRWTAAGIIGGGFGNLFDRFFRPEGVVDFIDVEFFGLFGLDRWPTFNVADSAVVVCGSLLFISMLFTSAKNDQEEKSGRSDSAGKENNTKTQSS